jgi:hypothetical protein
VVRPSSTKRWRQLLAVGLHVEDHGSLAGLADGVIDELDVLHAMPRPDHTKRVVQELLALQLQVSNGRRVARKQEAAEYQDAAFETARLLIRAFLSSLASNFRDLGLMA